MRTLIKNNQELEPALPRLLQKRLVALDLETEGLDPHKHRSVLLAVGDEHDQYLIDCRSTDLRALDDFLRSPVLKVTHNGAFDAAMLRALDLRLEHTLDTMLFEQILLNGRAAIKKSLRALAEKYLGQPLDKSARLTFTDLEGELSESQLEYAYRDIMATLHVFYEQLPLLTRDNLESVAHLEAQAVPVFADLHYDGIYLDQKAWAALVSQNKQERDELRDKIDRHLAKVVQTDLFGRVDINLESDQELCAALTKLVGKPVRDVKKQTLRGLGHNVGELLVTYREKTKVVSAYGDNFLDVIHPKTQRIHADFLQIGAPTGRVACRNPNLQSIPRGSQFRSCFRGQAQNMMVTADYAGCELRILAQASGDPAFVSTFQHGGDLHSIVASQIFARPVSKEDNPQLRERAKAINFGLAYGMGAGGLAALSGLTLEEADRLLARYFKAFPKVYAYLEDSARQALHNGKTQTLSGRRLLFDPLQLQDGANRANLARVAKNMPIQGTSADMLKLALAGVRRRIRDQQLKAWIVNCVHDEILLEASADDVWDAATLVREEMIKAGQVYIDQVPIEVDVSVESTWQK